MYMYVTFGVWHIFCRKLEDAVREFEKRKLPPLDREKARVLKEEGNKYYKEGSYKKAIRYYSQGIQVCPATIREVVIDNMKKSKEKVPKW